MKFFVFGVISDNRLKDYFTEDTIPKVKPFSSAIPCPHPIGDIWFWGVDIETIQELAELINELKGRIHANPTIRFGDEYNPNVIDFTRSY